MLYESNAGTYRICKVQDVPLACRVPNLPDGLERNHKEILLFTHLIYNCSHIVCYWQFPLFCLRGARAL